MLTKTTHTHKILTPKKKKNQNITVTKERNSVLYKYYQKNRT